MPVIDPATLPVTKTGSDYPPPFDQPLAGRLVRDLSQAVGIIDFVANHVVVPPGAMSSQRHWHEGEDEFVVVLSGAGVLVDEEGRHPVASGSLMLFRKNDGNGHHLIAGNDAPLVLLALSAPEASTVHYSDIDLLWSPDGGETHRDGTPY